jgi:hypothetical protein
MRWWLVPGYSVGDKLCQEREEEKLTRDGSGTEEGLCDSGLEVDGLLKLDLGVALLNLLADPRCEGLSEDGIEDVDDVLQSKEG